MAVALCRRAAMCTPARPLVPRRCRCSSRPRAPRCRRSGRWRLRHGRNRTSCTTDRDRMERRHRYLGRRTTGTRRTAPRRSGHGENSPGKSRYAGVSSSRSGIVSVSFADGLTRRTARRRLRRRPPDRAATPRGSRAPGRRRAARRRLRWTARPPCSGWPSTTASIRSSCVDGRSMSSRS